jgi:hypothetical protein
VLPQETAMSDLMTPPEPKNPTATSEGTREALDSTTRPLRSDHAGEESTPPEEDTSLRNLEPRSTEKQFGQAPDIQPEPDQARGVKEWVHESSEMDKSFPDNAAPQPPSSR